ncbi:hypothetical protein JCM11641_002211 [Rhodosporidiobolus odoratus]
MKFTLSTAALFAVAASLVSAAPSSSLDERATSATTFDDSADGTHQFIGYPVGTWTHLTKQGTGYYKGTESYTHDSNGEYQIYYGSGSAGLQIWASKKADRGYFDIYQGTELIGVGDAHGSCSGNYCKAEKVFEKTNLLANGNDITVRNRATDSRVKGVPFLSIDKAVIA